MLLRGHWWLEHPHHLCTFIPEVSFCKCQESRDKLFEMQSLLHPGSCMAVDYLKPLHAILEGALIIVLAKRWIGSCTNVFRSFYRIRALENFGVLDETIQSDLL